MTQFRGQLLGLGLEFFYHVLPWWRWRWIPRNQRFLPKAMWQRLWVLSMSSHNWRENKVSRWVLVQDFECAHTSKFLCSVTEDREETGDLVMSQSSYLRHHTNTTIFKGCIEKIQRLGTEMTTLQHVWQSSVPLRLLASVWCFLTLWTLYHSWLQNTIFLYTEALFGQEKSCLSHTQFLPIRWIWKNENRTLQQPCRKQYHGWWVTNTVGTGAWVWLHIGLESPPFLVSSTGVWIGTSGSRLGYVIYKLCDFRKDPQALWNLSFLAKMSSWISLSILNVSDSNSIKFVSFSFSSWKELWKYPYFLMESLGQVYQEQNFACPLVTKKSKINGIYLR